MHAYVTHFISKGVVKRITHCDPIVPSYYPNSFYCLQMKFLKGRICSKSSAVVESRSRVYHEKAKMVRFYTKLSCFIERYV